MGKPQTGVPTWLAQINQIGSVALDKMKGFVTRTPKEEMSLDSILAGSLTERDHPLGRNTIATTPIKGENSRLETAPSVSRGPGVDGKDSGSGESSSPFQRASVPVSRHAAFLDQEEEEEKKISHFHEEPSNEEPS